MKSILRNSNQAIMKHKYTLFLILLTIYTTRSHSQNLVPNPSFEEYNYCPVGVSTLLLLPGISSVKDWSIPTTGTADYFNACGVRAVKVPSNGMGSQDARTGVAYTGAYMVDGYREYLQALLNTPLIKDHEYLVSFWVSLSDKSYYASDQIAAYLGPDSLVRSTNFGDPLDDLTPQIVNRPGNWLTDTAGWSRVWGHFVASGGEKVIILGNFSSHSELRSKAVGGGPASGHLYGYYYFDDVCVFDVTANSHISVIQRSLCPDSVVTLSGRRDKGNYTWSTGDTSANISVRDEGTYWVKSYGECEAWIDTFIVKHPQMPASLLGKDTVLCIASSITLQAPSLPNTTFYWQDGSTAEQYTVSETGKYSIHVVKDGCLYSDTIEIIINNFKQDLGMDTSVCKHTPYRIELHANIPPGAQVEWQDGSRDAVFHADRPGTYFVIVRDPLCINTDTMVITELLCDCLFDMPNAFSPNQDGRNDLFEPVIEPGCPVDGYSFSIYNRFGQRIYYSIQPGQGWNGSQNGMPADIGTYYSEIRFLGGTNKTEYYRSGDVLLIR